MPTWRRLLRWLFAGIFATACLLWICSYFAIQWAPGTKRHRIRLHGGTLSIDWLDRGIPTVPPEGYIRPRRIVSRDFPPLSNVSIPARGDDNFHAAPAAAWIVPGFSVGGFNGLATQWFEFRYSHDFVSALNVASAPLWPFATASLCLLWMLRPKPAPFPGHCMKCGYDLRTNESGICPECGLPIPPATSDAAQTPGTVATRGSRT